MVLELMAVEVESLSGRRLVGCFSVGFPRAGTTWTTSSGSWKCPTSTRSCDGGGMSSESPPEPSSRGMVTL